MMTFSINTLGCKVNQYESQQVRELLERLGLHRSEPSEQPDLIIVNTCCVTHIASSKSRQQIRKARKLYPNAVIVVCGCLPVVQIGESTVSTQNINFVKKRDDLAVTLSKIVKIPHVFISRDDNKGTLNWPDYLLESGQNNIIKSKIHSKIKHKLNHNSIYGYTARNNIRKTLDGTSCANATQNTRILPQLTSFDGQTRAFLKVQDGCDGYCTYCIVPQTRPFVRSQTVEHVLREAQALVNAGHKEIVITGIFLGAYGQKSVRRKSWLCGVNSKLADLLDKIAQIPNLARVRLSSLEPADVTPELLDVFCSHSNFMPHLHLSLQSVSDAVIKRMCRQYNIDQFREKVELIKSRLDRPAITTDIIVGFPGETDADFEQTVSLAKDIGFARMHVFRFSPRKGTAAAKMPDAVDIAVIKNRSEILRELDVELGQKFRQQFIGEFSNILIESQNGNPGGRSERYFMVDINPKDISNSKYQIKNNDIVKVLLVKNNKTSMTGYIGAYE